jgi:hypothetical protein
MNRYERLKETLDEYLGEDGTDSGSGPFLRDLQKACIELKYFHETCLDNYNHVHDFFL